MMLIVLQCLCLFLLSSAVELPIISEIPRSEVNAWNVDATINFQEATVTVGTLSNFKTRLIDGSIPGPTMRLKRGDKVRITMTNNLDETNCGFANGAIVTNGVMNEIRDPCVVNLHTHGLHVSSVEPQDNVMVQIKPGGSYTYEYQIPADHLGGTHWYHPHHHGSTGGHVSGGASGAIIVEDDASDNLPSAIVNLPERVILLTAISEDVAEIEAAGGGTWMTTAPSSPMLLANGLKNPTLTVASGSSITWMRLRFAFSAAGHSLAITIPSACKAVLLAKDGVYLPFGSREVSVIKFAAGNRADIALSCSIGVHTLSSSPDEAGGGGGGGGDDLGGPMEAFPNYDVMTVDWKEAGGGSAASSLPALTYNAPAYLKDLTSTDADETFDKGIDINGTPGGCEFPCGVYEHNTVLNYMSVNKVQEFSVNAGAHPFHMHINHMQLIQVGDDGWGGWHQEGDFLDTFLGTGTVRFTTDTFTGEVIMHCHLLVHEDNGCMTHMMIVDDKNDHPWGYCLHGDAIPSVPSILMSTLSAFLSCLLVLAYSGRLQKVLPEICCPQSGFIMYMEKETFGAFAVGLMLPFFVASVLPLVNDDGYNGGLVSILHANEDSYNTFLPLFIVCMVVVLGCATYLIWFRFFNESQKILSIKTNEGDVDMVLTSDTPSELTEMITSTDGDAANQQNL
jgi:FtsP/CotA-like multicopper oxidase with cupredoxin domain